MAKTIVSDFDGTIVTIPNHLRAVIGSNLNYIEDREPNYNVLMRFGANPVIIVTGRSDIGPIEAYCQRYGIVVDRIIPTPARLWSENNAGRKMQEHKARVINQIRPDVVIDDDAEVLKMVASGQKYLVDHQGAVRPL